MDIKREPIEIRWAKREEWKPAMMMIWKTFMEFEGKEEMGPKLKEIYDTLTGIQMGRIEAPEGWVYTI